jgi:hypothetical protein
METANTKPCLYTSWTTEIPASDSCISTWFSLLVHSLVPQAGPSVELTSSLGTTGRKTRSCSVMCLWNVTLLFFFNMYVLCTNHIMFQQKKVKGFFIRFSKLFNSTPPIKIDNKPHGLWLIFISTPFPLSGRQRKGKWKV